jgi:quinol monooxygenase YgiN
MGENLRLDYDKTLQQFTMLADIRFKLLAFVPTLAGIAVALLDEKVDSATALAVGVLGLVMTLGILIYEVRNSQLYDAVIHRAKFLESQLNLPLSTPEAKKGGAFNERPGRGLKLFGMFSIWHDRGLSLAYGAALGGWAFIIADSTLKLVCRQDHMLAAIIGVITGTMFAREIMRLSGEKRPGPMAAQKGDPFTPPPAAERTLKNRRPASRRRQLAAAVIASLAAISANILFFLVLKYILKANLAVPDWFSALNIGPDALKYMTLVSTIFSIGASIVFLIIANRAEQPGLHFVEFSLIVLVISLYLTLNFATPTAHTTTMLILASMQILGVAVLVPLLIYVGLPYFDRRNFMLVRTWRVKVRKERSTELEDYGRTVSLPLFKQQAGCLGVLFTRDENNCAMISFWENEAAVERFKTSQSYKAAVQAIEDSEWLEDKPSVELAQSFGGFLDLDKVLK